MEFVKLLFSWFNKNILDILLVVVGGAAFFTYIWESRRKMKTAATVVLNQINEIEEAVKMLKISREINDTVIYKSKQIISSENYWHKYKHLLLRKLKSNQIQKIDKLYSQAEDIEKSRVFICNELLATINSKNLVYQLNVASEIVNTGNFNPQVSPMNKYYSCGATFSSGAPREYFDDLLRTYEKLSDTPDGIEAYRKLKKLSYSKRL